MMSNFIEIGRRLKEARIRAGYRFAREAAEALGVKYPTYASHENGSRDQSKEIGLYARRFKVTTDWLLTGREAKLSPLQYSNPEPSLGLEVVGRIEAGQFRDITLEDQDRVKPRIGVGKDQRFSHAEQYALLVSGDSMNEKFPDGCYVTCVELVSSGLKLRPGMNVHVERTLADTHLVETTLKEIQSINGKVVLIPRSSNPKHLPIEIIGDDQTEIRIRGVVTGMWVPQPL